MASGFDWKQCIASVAGVVALTAIGVQFPPLLVAFGAAGIVLAVRMRPTGRGLLLVAVVWLLLGLVFSAGLGTSSSTGQANETGSLTR